MGRRLGTLGVAVRFYPVVHVESEAQAAEQVSLAREADADGAWLINHDPAMGCYGLLDIFRKVRQKNPEFWLGLNFLDLVALEAMCLVVDESHIMGNRVDGLWTDDALIGADAEDLRASSVWGVKHNRGWSGLYFGGVAFKGQRHVSDVAAEAKRAAPHMDVVTTSGVATGVAAPVERVRSMREALSYRPLALASGVTVENALDYLPYVDHFLVASGISRSFHELDFDRTRQLAAIIHGGP